MSSFSKTSPIQQLLAPVAQQGKISALDAVAAKPLKSRWVDRFAKKTLLGLFARLQKGHLIFHDGGETWHFGEPLDSAAVVAEVDILHPSFYRTVLFGGSIGSGEAYMTNSWQARDLVAVIRVIVMNLAVLEAMDSGFHHFASWVGSIIHKANSNSKTGSRRNISAHYDLSNDFFALFLDKTLMYSAAIYPHATASLHEASLCKLQHVCDRLQLSASDHLLEIGTGWGGMAIYAAQTTGCSVTTVTISAAQWAYAKAQVEALGLQDKIRVLLCDYRDITGEFDKLVSIEMIEAVGYEYYRQYFSRCASLLKPEGLMLIQAITIPHPRFHAGRHKLDFIRRYIFPGGCLPSQQAIVEQVSKYTDLEVVGMEDITAHYARTLADWRRAFFANTDAVKALGFDDVFIRMWDYYLCYCEGGFTERVISTSQWLFAKPQARALPQVR
jgi:cyclopropane-fatty-acyl-phospholipid synthase